MKQNQNNKSVKRPKIKKGDQVVVIAGDDKGPDVRRVLAVYPKTNRVLVEGVAVAKRAYKKGVNPQLPEGGIHDKEMPISISNVMLADPKGGQPTRIGVRVETKNDGTKIRVRYAKASGADIKE